MSWWEGEISVNVLAREHLFPVGFSSARTQKDTKVSGSRRRKSSEPVDASLQTQPATASVETEQRGVWFGACRACDSCARGMSFQRIPARGAPPARSSWSCDKTFRLPLKGLRSQPSHSSVEELPARYRTARDCGATFNSRATLPERSDAGFFSTSAGGQLRGAPGCAEARIYLRPPGWGGGQAVGPPHAPTRVQRRSFGCSSGG